MATLVSNRPAARPPATCDRALPLLARLDSAWARSPREVLTLAGHALRRGLESRDEEALVRLARGRAHWVLAGTAQGHAEIVRALGCAETERTRARAERALAELAWRRQDLEEARRRLEASRVGLEQWPEDADAQIALEAGLLRDEGSLERSLDLHNERVSAASGDARCEARARSDRGALLILIGRWQEAGRDLARAEQLLAGGDDRRGMIQLGIRRASLQVATGDLVAARACLAAVREQLGAGHDDPRAFGEMQLVVASLELVAGEAARAEQAAAAAVEVFTSAGDRPGESRARMRRSHALLMLGQNAEAEREARRAGRSAVIGADRALADLALGRALLRRDRDAARSAFESALEHCDGRSGVHLATRLGHLLARGVSRDSQDVRLALVALEMWGDRRLLSMCLKDLDVLRSHEAPSADGAPADEAYCPESEPLVDAALALAGDGDWSERWTGALRAVAPVLPWWRAAYVGRTAWELRADLARPVPLAEADLVWELARDVEAPIVMELVEHPRWHLHPVRALHGLASALVVRAGEAVLYLDRRSGTGWTPREVGLAVQLGRLLARQEPPAPAADAPAPFPEIVGRCSGLQRLFHEMQRVAATGVPVHISGETGTGKERVARALHQHSARRERPFVTVNASAISDELFESEMFGHVRGAFTGAVADRKGLVEQAEGGTLFIDEVVDLSPRAQAKLLRFLAEGEYRRVGQTELRRADVRVLTAANVALRERVSEGRLREDLMYRLAPFTLVLPPLRERGDDVALLARHLLREAAAREGRTPPRLSPEVLRVLESYAWPGNVRELEGEMRRVMVLACPGPVRLEHLSPRLTEANAATVRSLRHALRQHERDCVRRALEQNGGHRARTARELGITRQALAGKMKRLGLG